MTRTRRHVTSLVLAACVAALTALVGLSPSFAARTASVQAGYTCQMLAEGYPATGDPYEEPVTISMQLQVPDQVAPGQSVALRGVFAMQFSESMRKLASDYFTYIDGYSDTVSVRLTINGRTTTLRADRWSTGRTQIGNPMVVRGQLTFPSFTVPAGSSGSITIGLPHNDVTKNTLWPEPKTVAMTGIARASGGRVPGFPSEYNYRISCYTPKANPGTVAVIPVSGAATAPTTGTPATGGAATGAPAEGLPATTGDPAAVPTDAAGAPLASAGTQPVAGVATAEQGVYVPARLLVLLGIVVCVGAAGYAALTHYRLGIVRDALDD